MAASMKMVVFWVVVPFSLVEGYQCFSAMEAARTSKMLVTFYQIHGATTQKTAIFNFLLFI
jgi:hypothetical protein